ncbi:N-hydroxyarylamine O-acetyltransferase [Sporormia fimetaria CBS 119925]|uniref:N-hydroxyarylamine O-acetyltransferase n=1 Tax=Sporormia fimetaria CBS 119925 TaxID=1340428 RepID=A0A6A6VIR3_9PLEO|nr:N-hydroxyarylamine O-acetyltransferase [Sporormia fimetaria CBS 119925]
MTSTSKGPQAPTISRDQVTAYFDRIKLPETERHYEIAGFDDDTALSYLQLLQKHHLVWIPFENLTLHYSFHRQISINPDDLFKKIVSDDNGRGGYCMENNTLFATLLRTLGFTLHSAGARVFDDGQWTGWSHMVNIVRIGPHKWHVDVGFGGNGPIAPMRLDKAGWEASHVRPASARLQWRNIPGNTDPDQRLWVYEFRISEDGDFQPTYCFTELEFLQSDYSLMNYYTSTSQRTFFTRVVVAERKIMVQGAIVGSLIMGNGDLKWRVHGKKTQQIQFENEEDRLQALEKHFGIVFGQAERASIRGLPSELK